MSLAPTGVFNVGDFLTAAAARWPDARALIYKRGARWHTMTFARLDRLCDSYAHGLRRQGVRRGQRVLLMLRGGPEFVAVTFATFKLGALPVLIDPGMGLRGLLACVQQVQADVLIGIPAAHLLRGLFRATFSSVERAYAVGGPSLFGALRLDAVAVPDAGPFPAERTQADEDAAILFTSGSTGPAKGVLYRHGIFRAQVVALQQMFGMQPGEIDMPGFPLFALFSTAMGVTCLLPELNPSRPATADPAKLVAAIQRFGVTSCQGSPAIWTRVGDYCAARRITLPSLKRVLTFGAAIAPELIHTWRQVLAPEADVYTPYGATEALPVATISGHDVLTRTARLTALGHGTCVGRPVPGTDVRVIRVTDEAIESWHGGLEVAAGEVGEIVVAGEVVTHAYDGLAEATRRAKIQEGERSGSGVSRAAGGREEVRSAPLPLTGRIWHRMGDLGYFDRDGRLWFCGRKAHRVQGMERVYDSVCGEGIFNQHSDVFRTALVGVGPPAMQEPVLFVEPRPGKMPVGPMAEAKLSREILDLAKDHPLFSDVRRVFYRRRFPVDARHNAKIHREELAAEAERAARSGALYGGGA